MAEPTARSVDATYVKTVSVFNRGPYKLYQEELRQRLCSLMRKSVFFFIYLIINLFNAILPKCLNEFQ